MEISPLWWAEGVSGDEWDVFYCHVGVELNDSRSNRDKRNEHVKRIKRRISLQMFYWAARGNGGEIGEQRREINSEFERCWAEQREIESRRMNNTSPHMVQEEFRAQ